MASEYIHCDGCCVGIGGEIETQKSQEMKRPIKFKRVYQHDRTGMICMVPWGNIDQEGNDIYDFGCFKSPSSLSSYYPIADNQFTGLFDKNGKEIYEGDIIQLADISYPITFNDGAFQMIGNENQGRSDITQQRAKKFTIIGNIFENPESKFIAT
jgi:hypothetical protein